MPIAEIATVIGSTTAQNGVGDATSSSRTPSRRCVCSAPAPDAVVDDQIPITPDASAATRQLDCRLRPWNRKYASVAKISGDATTTNRSNGERLEHLEMQPKAEEYYARERIWS